ncbi:delta-lactam-biosynthetic de-N-acetylase [Calidifontibacillus oryziterrae]|uniref:delta-lactam-biosynthetic de-N-acetylase n=1 Tax=Calidifontibacillus oryziterrae TaxID=1191699 RepID=UPI0002FFC409|nr:delta-lactam-biosynthetic de-N-acetylase [Calidifontibacillus oryziterrae]
MKGARHTSTHNKGTHNKGTHNKGTHNKGTQSKRTRNLIQLLLIVVLFVVNGAITQAEPISNKSLHWGLKRSVNHEPPDAGAVHNNNLQKYGSFYLGDTTKKDIYLTFDNGYENGYTEEILDVLKKKDVPAAFFVTGHYLTKNEDLIKRMVDEGHIIGNHSWHHPDLTQVSDTRLAKELNLIKEEYERQTGRTDMMYLRPPRGIYSERTLKLSQQLGYVNVFWSLAYIDWYTDRQKGWRYAYDNIMKQIHPGAIILLHAVSEDNAKALSNVIDDLRKEGYTFKSLDDLMFERSIPKPLLYQQYFK